MTRHDRTVVVTLRGVYVIHVDDFASPRDSTLATCQLLSDWLWDPAIAPSLRSIAASLEPFGSSYDDADCRTREVLLRGIRDRRVHVERLRDHVCDLGPAALAEMAAHLSWSLAPDPPRPMPRQTRPTPPPPREAPSEPPTPRPTYIDVVVVDPEGRPITDRPWRMRLPDGSIASGMLGPDGRVFLDGIEGGICTLSFPTREERDWRPADAPPE